jgi:hypothetical protein
MGGEGKVRAVVEMEREIWLGRVSLTPMKGGLDTAGGQGEAELMDGR